MIERFKRAGLVWPTILAVAGTVVLLSLGNWQWQRMAWKNDLESRLAEAATAEPRDFGELLKTSAPEDIRFRRVTVTGRFRHDLELHYWQPASIGPAWAVLTPLVLSEPVLGEEHRGKRNAVTAVLIDRGIVPDARKDPAARGDGQPDGEVTITGRIRLGGAPGVFVSPPNFEKNQWYARDMRGMREHLAKDRGAEDIAAGLPRLYIEAEQPATGTNAPQPNLEALQLANRHLSYALTWWGLAATLIGVYAVFAWTRLQRTRDA